ncbi:MAG: topoisomerase C-terminal repeat-containing protein [Vampirovibrionales bacterium]
MKISRKDTDPESVTLEEAVALIEAKKEKRPKPRLPERPRPKLWQQKKPMLP